MTLNFDEPLPEIAPSFWYVATPYSKYPGGMEEAFKQACIAAAEMLRLQIPLFCPIAHTHSIAMEGKLERANHDFWLPADQPMIDAAGGIIVVEMENWQESVGVLYEIKEFKEAGKPVRFLEWPV